MATDRTKTGLMIGLIIFVITTFTLAVTTYIGFQQRHEELQKATAFQQEAQKAKDQQKLTLDTLRLIRELIGADPRKETADSIEAERNELFDKIDKRYQFTEFAQGGAKKTFLELIDWLDDALDKKDKQLQTATDETKRLEEQVAAAEKERDRALEEVKQVKAATQVEIQKANDAFAARWAGHDQAQKEMTVKLEAALAAVEQMRAMTEEIDKFAALLPPESRRKFETAGWPERVRLVLAEFRNGQKTAARLNTTLARVGLADPRLQELVRDSTPQNERIDGFDGRVVTVNSVDRTVLFACDSTAGMRPGLVLSVYDPADPRPQIGARKGVIEVIEVEAPGLARARIVEDSAAAPILAGDGVASNFWAPDAEQEVVIVGYVRFGSGGKQDAAALAAIAERHGARVVDGVTPQTVLVVDAGLPKTAEGVVGGGRNWKPVDEVNRRNALARAKELGVRVVSLDGLLDMLGLDRETLDGRRLPTEIGAAP